MNQEDKELLLRDICARLPYGVVCENIHWPNDGYVEVHNMLAKEQKVQVFEDWIDISECRPYLRPMSSMTEVEKKECCAIFNNCMYKFEVDKYGDICSTKKTVERENIYYDIELMDKWVKWLNAHHFDFRNLIEKGLALEATTDTYSD